MASPRSQPPAEAEARSVPHSLEAERAVLGAVLVNADLLDLVEDALEPADFFRKAHARIFETIREMAGDGTPVDLLTLRERLAQRALLEECGGAAYLASLSDGVPRSANVAYYASIVKEKARLRFAIEAGSRLVEAAYADSAPRSADLLSDAGERLLEAGGSAVAGAPEKIGDLVWDSVRRLEEAAASDSKHGPVVTGMPSGFESLDTMTCGLQASDLILIAARTSQGKTALAMNIAAHVAKARPEAGAVLIFSLEMTKHQLIVRLIAAEARVDGQKLRQGQLDNEEWDRVSKALQRLADLNIMIDDTPSIGIREARARARQVRKDRGLSLVIIDYIQLMKGRGRFDNRTQEVGLISRGCKALAKELNVPLVALAQLSRAPEAGPGRKARAPQLSDLRESGDLEADADMVWLIYRPEPKKGSEEEERPIAEIIVAKQRNGPTGTAKLVFMRPYASFDNESLV